MKRVGTQKADKGRIGREVDLGLSDDGGGHWF